jgi:hypothetical protein
MVRMGRILILVLCRSPNSNSSRDPNVETRRKMTRYYKRLGDLCLLAGAPQDAKNHFETAISTGRSVGEYVFVACAHEGLAASVLLEVAAHESSSAAAFLERYDQCAPLSVFTHPHHHQCSSAVQGRTCVQLDDHCCLPDHLVMRVPAQIESAELQPARGCGKQRFGSLVHA